MRLGFQTFFMISNLMSIGRESAFSYKLLCHNNQRGNVAKAENMCPHPLPGLVFIELPSLGGGNFVGKTIFDCLYFAFFSPGLDCCHLLVIEIDESEDENELLDVCGEFKILTEKSRNKCWSLAFGCLAGTSGIMLANPNFHAKVLLRGSTMEPLRIS